MKCKLYTQQFLYEEYIFYFSNYYYYYIYFFYLLLNFNKFLFIKMNRITENVPFNLGGKFDLVRFSYLAY